MRRAGPDIILDASVDIVFTKWLDDKEFGILIIRHKFWIVVHTGIWSSCTWIICWTTRWRGKSGAVLRLYPAGCSWASIAIQIIGGRYRTVLPPFTYVRGWSDWIISSIIWSNRIWSLVRSYMIISSQRRTWSNPTPMQRYLNEGAKRKVRSP